jgi:polyphosphate glucokinase
MNILAIDIGGTWIKVLLSGRAEPRKIASSHTLTPEQLVEQVHKATADWEYDVISIGFPGPVANGRPLREPWNLGTGWVGFNFQRAFDCPVRVVNDAAMQALGSYSGEGKMLFLGLGTGLGSCMIVDGIVEPMELGHLPYMDSTFEDYVGQRGLERLGQAKWQQHIGDVVARLIAALEPDEVVLGGGNVNHLDQLPAGCRAGTNDNAFVGAFRLWENPRPQKQPEALRA